MTDLYNSYREKASELETNGMFEKANNLYRAAERLSKAETTDVRTIQQGQKVTDIKDTYNYLGNLVDSVYNGDKFPGSFGFTKDYSFVDYYTLRIRSVQLFKENPYARGMIKRLLRNEINTGLNLEALPIADLIGLSEDEADEWAEKSETDWTLWGNDAEQCDFKKKDTLGKIAENCRQTALISGDCLVVLRINKKTGLPMIELVDGSRIKTPFMQTKAKNGNDIKHGVELDKNGRQTAYYVEVKENKKTVIKRIPAKGEKSGRKISWLVYGCDKRLDDVRGEPILSLVLYMLKELNRAMDSEQRAATINAMLPLFIEKTQQTVTGGIFGNGAVKRGTTPIPQADGSIIDAAVTGNIPGMVADNLAHGEKPVSFDTKRPNTSYGKFEEIIVNTVAWALELPPEIARLMFQSNFSASRQANSEFDVYLRYRSVTFGNEFYQPIYKERLISSVLLGQMEATGLLEAWRDPKQWRIVGAWCFSLWSGISRPSVDFKKEVAACEIALKSGTMTYDDCTRRLTGKSFKAVALGRSKEQKLMEKLGLSFSAEENNNGEQVTEVQTQTGTNITNINNKLDDITEKLEEMEV